MPKFFSNGRRFHEVAFHSEADLLHEDSGWRVVAFPHTNYKIPCSQQVQEQWHQLNQHQAFSCSSEPSDQLILWQQLVQQQPQLHLLNTQDWQELSSKAEDAELPCCFMTDGGGVLHKAALGLSPVGEEIPVACKAWQVCTLYQIVINGIHVHHLVNSKQT